jgi:hypothetical protein
VSDFDAGVAHNEQPDVEHRHYDTFDAGKEWGTPVEIWRLLAEPLDGFDIDLAAGAEPFPVAPRRVTKTQNLFATPINDAGDAFCNPPYGRGINDEWSGRLVGLWESGVLDTLTVVVPNSSDTDWYDRYAGRCDIKTELDTRVQFYGSGEHSASFATVVFSFGEFSEQYHASLEALGRPWRTL